MVMIAWSSLAQAQTVRELTDLLCDRTLHFFEPEVGNQIQYTAPDGSLHLWFPGRNATITGRWSVVQNQGEKPQICLSFDEENPAGGPIEQCHALEEWQSWLVEGGTVAGDPYALTSGAPPFLLPQRPQIPRAGLARLYPDVATGPRCALPVS